MIKKIKNLIKNHWLAIIIACLVGIVTVLPQLLLMSELQDEYKGIAITGTDVEEYYNMRVQEAYDGHYKISNTDLYEYKDKPYVQTPLPEIIVATLAKIFGLTARQMVTFGKFLFPPLIYLILYALTLSFTKNKAISLAAPVAIMLGSNFIFRPREIFHLLTFKLSELTGMVDYTRPINPQLASLFFFTWFLLFYNWLKNNKKAFFISSTILLGLIFYIYPYSWMLAYGITGLIFILSLFNKKTGLNLSTKKLIMMLVMSLVIAIPYWLNHFQLTNDPSYELLKKFYGFFTSHEPLWSNLLFIDLILLFIIYWKKKSRDINFYLLLSVLASIAILINQQVITGLRFYPGHWHWYYTTPFTIFIGLLFVYKLLKNKKKLIIVISIIVIVLNFINGLAKQRNTYFEVKEQTAGFQRYMAIYDWFNQNTKKDDVVLTDGHLNVRFPIYTHNNIYLTRYGEFFLVPFERFEDRFLARLYLKNVNKENIDQYVTGDYKDAYELLFGRYIKRKGLCKPECFTEEELAVLKEKYLKFAAEVDFETFLKKYRLDYAVWDTQIDQDWNLDNYSFMEFITEINGIRIYKVI